MLDMPSSSNVQSVAQANQQLNQEMKPPGLLYDGNGQNNNA
jgi:hypothetical protein